MVAAFSSSIELITLVLACCWGSSSSQNLGPGDCLINRLEVIPCAWQLNTSIPGPNEYGIYQTRFRSGDLIPSCEIRQRNQQIRDIEGFGINNRVLFIFSPGYTLGDVYNNQQYVEWNIECGEGKLAFFNITDITLEEKTCADPNRNNELRCVDYVQVHHSAFGVSESCGTDASNIRELLEQGSFRIIFRTSTSGRFPGFAGSVICFDPSLADLPGCSTVPTEGALATIFELQGRQAMFEDLAILEALEQQNACNAVLRALAGAVLESADPERVQNLRNVASLRFEEPSYTASESDPNVQVCVVVINPPASPIMLEYTTRRVTANDSDFFEIQQPIVQIVNFTTSNRRSCVNIMLWDDFVPENTESFLIVLTSETTGVQIRYNVTEIIILDDDNRTTISSQPPQDSMTTSSPLTISSQPPQDSPTTVIIIVIVIVVLVILVVVILSVCVAYYCYRKRTTVLTATTEPVYEIPGDAISSHKLPGETPYVPFAMTLSSAYGASMEVTDKIPPGVSDAPFNMTSSSAYGLSADKTAPPGVGDASFNMTSSSAYGLSTDKTAPPGVGDAPFNMTSSSAYGASINVHMSGDKHMY